MYLQEQTYCLYKGTSTAFYPSGEQFWEALLIDLQKAERFIFEYFIIRRQNVGRHRKILIEKAQPPGGGAPLRLLSYPPALPRFALRLESASKPALLTERQSF